MKLGLHTIAFHSFPIDYAVERTWALGYQGIELNAETNWALPHITPSTSASVRGKLARDIFHHGLAVSSICAHTSLISADPEARREGMRFMKGCIDMAGEFGTSIVHAISGRSEQGVKRSDAWEWLVGNVGELVDYSGSKGSTLGFEAAVNQLVARSSDMKELMKAVGGEKLFVNFDPSHAVLYGEDPVKLVRLYGDKIVHFHAKDSLGNPRNFKFPPLGSGIVDFENLLVALSSIGYQGFVSVEYEGELFGYEKDPVIAATRAKEFLTRLPGPKFQERVHE